MKTIKTKTMKTLKQLPLLLTLSLILLLSGCSNDDDDVTIPEPVNEEELITTLTLVLTPTGTTGTPVTFQFKDLDGDGPMPPEINDGESLLPNTTYNGVITLLNETEDPAEDITEEVEEESNEHQFFYTIGSGLNLTTAYANEDENGNPLGTELTVTTTESSAGTLTFTLRHEPKKPNDGTTDDAGGETDISATFSVVIQ